MDGVFRKRGFSLFVAIAGGLIILVFLIFLSRDNAMEKSQHDIGSLTRSFGTPIVSAEYPKISGKVAQVADDGLRIYVLYKGPQHMDGVVQVYNYDGHYICTLFFYCHVNGGFRISTASGTLYVSDYHGNIYILDNLQLTSVVKNDWSDDWKKLHSELDWDSMSASFSLRDGDIYAIAEDKCIIENVEKESMLSQVCTVLITVICILSVVFWGHIKKLKQDGEITH